MDSDVVIVGGGTAGAVLAARLSEDPARTVTLIEAGPDYRGDELPAELRDGAATELDPTTRDHNWVWDGRPARGSARQPILGRRVTGGGSAINGQVFLRGSPADFDLWAGEAGAAWSFEAVLPFYRRAETDLDFGSAAWHGSSGPVPVRRFGEGELLEAQVRFRDACVAAGFAATADHNAPDATGVGVVPVNNLAGIRMSTALCYLELARDRPNLTILGRTTATRVLISGQRTCGVEIGREGAPERILADQVIISAGSVGSVLLMVQSGLGPARELRRLGLPVLADLPAVGQNLEDHSVVRTSWRVQDGAVADPAAFRNQMCLRFSSGGFPGGNDLKLSVSSLSWSYPGCIDLYTGVQAGASRGRVRLERSGGRLVASVRSRLLDAASDRRRLRDAVDTAIEMGRGDAFRGFVTGQVSPAQPVTDAWIARVVRSGLHMSCTNRMGTTPDSVVDDTGAVHGVEGLRIVDASIMPHLVRGNPMATVVMVAERIAAFLQNPA